MTEIQDIWLRRIVQNVTIWICFGLAGSGGLTVGCCPALGPRGSASRQAILSQFSSRPALKYRPHAVWHWINGNVIRDGIDRDIEALYNSGYGGVLQYDVNAGIPKGPVELNSDK
ncbi:uncharacterized protein PAC_11746 [Phialocephala subalpina]|uniref:Uncharacterized protein n=1 Tax=Phialocephala subalpina TaxID=576137 RepID=A0A1L7XA02_9HELO|nr:uncharacterized protein PAC_11746 [Phialocephala subalpina]